MIQRLLAILLPVLAFAAVCLLVEWVVNRGTVQSFILPPPSEIWAALTEENSTLWNGLWETTLAALSGFGLSVILGTLIAILLASNRYVKYAIYPYAIFFQTVPIIAIAPMLVIWTNTQFQTVVIAACIASIFPVIANTYAGLSSTDPALRELFKLYGAGPVSTLLKLKLPWALPNIFTGLRVAAGLAVIGAMVGEFVGGSGLGSVIDGAKGQIRNDIIFAAVLLASVMGLGLFVLIDIVARLTLRHWHASAKDQ